VIGECASSHEAANAGADHDWTPAEIAVMGPKGAVEIIFRADLGDEAAIEEYREKFANPFAAASRGFIDDVILPRGTRRRLCRALAMLRGKQLANPTKKTRQHPAVIGLGYFRQAPSYPSPSRKRGEGPGGA